MDISDFRDRDRSKVVLLIFNLIDHTYEHFLLFTYWNEWVEASSSSFSVLFSGNNFNYYLPISRSRQLYSTENQGRNFFMEKLCELGLGEVSYTHKNQNYLILLHKMNIIWSFWKQMLHFITIRTILYLWHWTKTDEKCDIEHIVVLSWWC